MLVDWLGPESTRKPPKAGGSNCSAWPFTVKRTSNGTPVVTFVSLTEAVTVKSCDRATCAHSKQRITANRITIVLPPFPGRCLFSSSTFPACSSLLGFWPPISARHPPSIAGPVGIAVDRPYRCPGLCCRCSDPYCPCSLDLYYPCQIVWESCRERVCSYV